MAEAYMAITATIACRVDCDFCPQELLIKEYELQNNLTNISYGNPNIMDFSVFKQCIDKIPENVQISFGGYSEIFLHPEAAKMILYAFDSGHKISIYSTLVGLKLEDIDKIKHIPFANFHIHLPDSSSYAKIAVNKNYLAILKKLQESNIKNLTCMSMGDLHPKVKDILHIDIEAEKMISRAGNLSNVKNDFEKKLGPLSCNISSHDGLEDRFDANTLLPNGDVTLCCMDYGLKNIIGNLTRMDYNSLFTNDEFKKIYNKMKSYDDEIICRYCNQAIPEQEIEDRKNIVNKYNNETAHSVINLYQKLLNRFPDKEGFYYFYSKLSTGELSITDIENHIKQSFEYGSRRTSKLT
ncbi:MAG: hypothetical protein CMO14_02050 [Thaumarchaeota archaeon]|jgi:hypothetical protein|nr:hypothetical protein [Nitrososphaerota archaeon]|tara:strand:- start:8639 stop:9697 length:1059 start_codon:yes stop_codon:yes gene_type:complete